METKSTRQLTALEYHYLIEREFRAFVGAWLDKVQQSQGKFRFKFRRNSLVFSLPDYAYAANQAMPEPDDTGFIQKLKKHVSGKKLAAISQVSNDRIIALDFEGREAGTRVIVELFQKGNCVIEENGKIAAVLSPDDFSDRKLRAGVQYLPPKNTGLKFGFTAVELKKLFGERKHAISALAKTHLGVTYARYVLGRCNIDPKKNCDELGWQELEAIAKENAGLLGGMKPFGGYHGGKLVDFALCALDESREWAEKESLSGLIAEYDGARIPAGAEAAAAKEEKSLGASGGGAKTQRKLEFQEAHLAALRQQLKESADGGNAIYADYPELEGLVRQVKGMAAGGAGEEEINAMLGKRKARFDMKKGELEIELEGKEEE